jgi:predicted HD phosphohydrolase
MIKNMYWSSCKVVVIRVQFELNFNIFEKYSNIKFHKNPFDVEPSYSMQMDRRTDMTKLVAFRNFADRPIKGPAVFIN